MVELCGSYESWHAIQSIPGVGPITASALLGQAGSGQQFKNGRHMSAWLGLVPKQNSSGGKSNPNISYLKGRELDIFIAFHIVTSKFN